MICFLVSFCLIFFPCMFEGAFLFFFLDTTLFSACFFNFYFCLGGFPPSVSCRLTDQAAFVMSVTASPLHHQCLTLTLALIFSQLPHPECWMPRLPLEASPLPPGCFWLALPAWFLVLAWVSCPCGGAVCVPTLLFFIFFCVHAASCSRGATLWSFSSCCRITTVPVLLSFSLLSWLKLF